MQPYWIAASIAILNSSYALWPKGRIKDKKRVSDVGDLLISSLLNFTTKTPFEEVGNPSQSRKSTGHLIEVHLEKWERI